MGVIRYAPPQFDYRPTPQLPADFLARLLPALREVTGTAWQVAAGEGLAEPTLLEQEQRQAADARARILETPVVKAAMAAFPDAELDDKLERWSAEA